MKNNVLNVPQEYYDLNDSDNVCYLCGNPNYELLYEVKHFGIPLVFKKCQCGLIKQTPMPNKHFFEWFFNSDIFFSSKKNKNSEIWGYYDYFADEPSRMATSHFRYNKLQHIFNSNKTLEVLKIGPSTGTFLHLAQLDGHNAIGCDISSEFAGYAKQHYNVDVDIGRFEEMGYDDERFDIILSLNVLENVCNQVEFLQSIYRTIKPGGHFIFNFVDMERNIISALQKSKYFLFRPPVCYIYTMSLMNSILKKFGFRIVDCHRDIRYMHIEKMATLLGWKSKIFTNEFLELNRKPFPIYAYPSKIIVAQKYEI